MAGQRTHRHRGGEHAVHQGVDTPEHHQGERGPDREHGGDDAEHKGEGTRDQQIGGGTLHQVEHEGLFSTWWMAVCHPRVQVFHRIRTARGCPADGMRTPAPDVPVVPGLAP